MAIISGYYGFTSDTTDNNTINHGNVKQCIFTVTFPNQPTDMTLVMSKGDKDWGASMGDGSIIPLLNPVPLTVNRDSAVVQFDMTEEYPSNSPCSLVFMNDGAYFSVTPRTSDRPFTPNTLAGHYGFTSDGYDAVSGTNGLVKTCLFSVQFSVQRNSIKVKISDDPSHWGAKMGDGSIISLRNPEIITTNMDTFVVKFDMDKEYPSNSPCALVYRNQGATISIIPVDDDTTYHNVEDIVGLPTTLISGNTLDLHLARILPYNATNQEMAWDVVSGPGRITKGYLLYASAGGTITLRGTAVNGKGMGVAYKKTFAIAVTQNVIRIDAEPLSKIDAYVGKVNYEISVVAKSTTNELKFQWYRNTQNTYSNGQAISGATQAEYKIPTSLTRGDYYFYCEVSSSGATSIKSIICHVYVSVECTKITIQPRTANIGFQSSRKLRVEQSPPESDLPKVRWFSSDTYVIDIDDDGEITSNTLTGSTTITARTIDGRLYDTLTISTPQYVSVSDITGPDLEYEAGSEYQMPITVLPSNASYKNIVWSILSAGGTGIQLSQTGKIKSLTTGLAHIRATIDKGETYNTPYIKEFYIRFTKAFIEITNIALVNDLKSEYYIDDYIKLEYKITPEHATNKDIRISILSGPGRISGNVLTFTGKGNIIVRCTANAAYKDGRNYTIDHTIKCNGEKTPKELLDDNIPVTGIIMNFLMGYEEDTEEPIYGPFWNPMSETDNPIVLPYSILPPVAAEGKKIDVKFTAAYYRLQPTDLLLGKTSIDPGETDPFWFDGDAWNVDNNAIFSYNEYTNVLSCDKSKLKKSMYYQLEFEISVENGISEGDPYIQDVIVKIKTETVVPFIPLDNFQIMKPSRTRTYYPILPLSLVFDPEEASIVDEFNIDMISFVPDAPASEDDAYAVIYKPDMFDVFHTVEPLPIFKWDLNTLYMFPYNPGILKLTVTIKDCAFPADLTDFDVENPTKGPLTKRIEIEILPPFVPVENILNMPTMVYANSVVKLSPEVSTGKGLNCYNPCWDEETATNSGIVWEVLYGDTLVSLEGNSNYALINVGTSTGYFGLRATIKEGTQEFLRWYDEKNEAIDYTQDFDIRIAPVETGNNEILTITTRSGIVVNVTKRSEMTLICSADTPDSSITIKGRTFLKNEVVAIAFCSNANIVDSLKNFARNFTSLTTLSGTIPSVSGKGCMENFLRGCTSFNQPISIPSSVAGQNSLKYFMKDCTSFNQSLTLPSSLIGDGCLHGFLDGCTSFNQLITIPSGVTGERCLENFLRGCTSFNQPINIPTGVRGYACLRAFLKNCKSFNHPLALPTNVGKLISNGMYEGRQLCNMLEGCDSMHSEVNVPTDTGRYGEISERAFSSYSLDSDLVKYGIKLTGSGAQYLIKNMTNTYELTEQGYAPPPYVHITNLD